jgi:hypothetical protein
MILFYYERLLDLFEVIVDVFGVKFRPARLRDHLGHKTVTSKLFASIIYWNLRTSERATENSLSSNGKEGGGCSHSG